MNTRSIAPLQEKQQLDIEVIDAVLGTSWKPLSRRPGSKMRMYIGDKDDDDDEHEYADALEALTHGGDRPEGGESRQEVTKPHKMILNRAGKQYNLM